MKKKGQKIVIKIQVGQPEEVKVVKKKVFNPNSPIEVNNRAAWRGRHFTNGD